MAGIAAAFKTLSDDHIVQYLLADVPFFCVGILSLGVFTFFVFMKRADSVLFALHMAVLVAFIAAILDLVQMLLRGSDDVDKAIGLKGVEGLIVAREVGFALSFGLRFLFYWGFVAQPIPGESPAVNGAKHNGSWGRWGVLGIILEMFTLTLTLVIPVLQILYRNIVVLHRIGALYEVEAALQIVLSVIFILKLLLNCWIRKLANTSVIPTRHTLASYSPVITALLLSGLIGIGNAAMFEFTETVLGRFLQAIEFYILIVYMLSSAFYHLRRRSWCPKRSSIVDSKSSPDYMAQVNVPEGVICITPPVISSPDLLSVVGQDVNSLTSRLAIAPQGSATSRMSSWFNVSRISERLSGRGNSSSPQQDEARLWSQDQAERGYSLDGRDLKDGHRDSGIDLDTPQSYNASQPLGTAKWQDPVYTSVIKSSLASTPPASSTQQYYVPRVVSPESQRTKPRLSPELAKITIPERTYTRQGATERQHTSPTPSIYESPPSMYGSPLSGVDDIVRSIASFDSRTLDFPPMRSNRDPSDAPLYSARSSHVSELIRQQAELDKSIEALRLLSPAERSLLSSDEEGGGVTRSQSDLSLSNFPEPPWGRASDSSTISMMPPPVPPLTIKKTDQAVIAEAVDRGQASRMLGPTEEQPPDVAEDLSDELESALLNNRSRINSGGTQYEITSFIGGLTRHDGQELGSFSSQSLTQGGQLIPPKAPWKHGPSDSFESLRSMQPSIVIEDAESTIPLRTADIPHSGSPPKLAFSAVRFSRPVGLPPRPRLQSADVLSPVPETPSSR